MSEAVAVPDWLREHYEKVDANEFAYVLGKFADDIEVRFGIRPPVSGKDAVSEVLADVHRPFESSVHRFTNVWQEGGTTLVEFDVTYTLNDGSQMTMETFSVIEREDGLIKSLRVYIDEGPLGA